jgi:hypothetical protein
MAILDTINLELKKYAPIFFCIKGYCFDILLNVNHSPSESGTIRVCFHYLMRLAHAINALSEFTKKLKNYIKDFGVSVILNKIKNAILHPWVTVKWIKNEIQKPFNFKIEFA